MIDIQAAIPIIVTAPFATMLFIAFFAACNRGSVIDKVIFSVGENNLTLGDVASFTSDLNPTLDALVTLIVVKPYRAATTEIFRNLKQKFVGSKTSTTSVTDMALVERKSDKRVVRI